MPVKICQHHAEIAHFPALSTTTHNHLTFNTISSDNLEKISLLADKRLSTWHSSYSSSRTELNLNCVGALFRIFQRIRLCLENVLCGILNACPLLRLLNYIIIISGKLYLWDCRSKQILPKVYGFRAKIIAKYETEKTISNKEFFKRKWILTAYLSNNSPNSVLFHCPVVLLSWFLLAL